MPVWFTEREYAVVSAASARLIPADQSAGAVEAGVPEYIDTLLGAFTFDPPRIWACGPTSGRFGGASAFTSFHDLGPLDELAWRMRIEGSQGIPAREFNGPVVGWQERYRIGIAALGDDFCALDPADQDDRLRAQPDFVKLLYGHCCEGMYGDPVYGGNRDLVGWDVSRFPGDVQPRGFSDDEVAGP